MEIKEFKSLLDIVVGALKEEFGNFRTNRPTTKLIENVRVEYMGSSMTLKQLATINIELPRDMLVSPWDNGSIPAIEKALHEEKSGLSVVNQGHLIRVKLPDMTEDRKKEMAKVVKASAEEARIKIRRMRDDANKQLKDLNEDQRFRMKDDIQKAVDTANKSIETLVETKVREIEE